MNMNSIGDLTNLAPRDMLSTYLGLKEYAVEHQVDSYPGDNLEMSHYDGYIRANLKGDSGGEYNLISMTVSSHDTKTGMPDEAVLTFDEIVDSHELLVGKNFSNPGDLSASPMCTRDEEFFQIDMKTGVIAVIDSSTINSKVHNWIVP
jgi:hypothetical protein